MNRPEEEKNKLLSAQQLHLRNATAARTKMNECIQHCKDLLTELNVVALPSYQLPLTGPEEGHYCFDFAQQVCHLCWIVRHSQNICFYSLLIRHRCGVRLSKCCVRVHHNYCLVYFHGRK